MQVKNMRVYCPNCGARFIHEKRAKDTILTCKRCAVKVRATIDNPNIYIKVMEEQSMIRIGDSS